MNTPTADTNDQQPTPPHGVSRAHPAGADAPVLAEIARLEAAIAAANARAAAARSRVADRDAAVREEMRRELERVQAQIEQMDREHEARLAHISAAAAAEVDAIRAAVRGTEQGQ